MWRALDQERRVLQLEAPEDAFQVRMLDETKALQAAKLAQWLDMRNSVRYYCLFIAIRHVTPATWMEILVVASTITDSAMRRVLCDDLVAFLRKLKPEQYYQVLTDMRMMFLSVLKDHDMLVHAVVGLINNVRLLELWRNVLDGLNKWLCKKFQTPEPPSLRDMHRYFAPEWKPYMECNVVEIKSGFGRARELKFYELIAKGLQDTYRRFHRRRPWGWRKYRHAYMKNETNLIEFLIEAGENHLSPEYFPKAAQWSDGRSIEYQHANIKVGDVFDYYTTSGGALKVPSWQCFATENSQLVKDINRKKEELKRQEEQSDAQEERIQSLEHVLKEEEEASTQRLNEKQDQVAELEKHIQQILQMHEGHRFSAALAQDEEDGQHIVRFGSLSRHKEGRESESSEELDSDYEPGTPPLTPPSISINDLLPSMDPVADQVVRDWTNNRRLRAAPNFDEKLAFDKMHELVSKLPYESQEDTRRVLTDLLDPTSTTEQVSESQILLRQVPEERQAELREFLVPLLKANHVLRVAYATMERRTLVTDVRILIERRRGSVLGGNVPGEKRFGKGHEFLGPSSENAGKLVPHTARALSTGNKAIYVSKAKGLNHVLSASASSPEEGSEHSTEDMDSSSEAGDMAEGTASNRKWRGLNAAKFIGTMAAGAKQRVATFKNSKYTHEGTSCQFCKMSPIVGERYSCAKCVGFDLCKTCYSRGGHGLENSDELFYRSDENVLAKCPRLRNEIDLLELMRFEICRSNLRMYTFSLNWVADIINGKSSRTLQVRALEIPGIRRDVRKIFVPLLIRACSHRKDIEIKTELELEGNRSGGGSLEDDEDDLYLETLRIWVKDQYRSTSPFAKRSEGEEGEEDADSDVSADFERTSDDDILTPHEEDPLFPTENYNKSGGKDSNNSVGETTSLRDSTQSNPFKNTFV
ncbi:hypothetical protein BBI17_006924 [Phytophthora kernoviae]|uniref:ZZ-type domain-containing protein n=1 Tax=Phytophthora kernoviae TaxID=325452 RepID=A0A3R7JBM0_9STRA|nr:hypothetical protein BBI17_006924 [Phytophthora kernoviae]